MRLLLLDIETAPNTAHVWGLWKENIPLDRLLESGYVMCWAAKWYGEKGVMFDSVHQSSPRQMLRRIHKLLDECDAVIHYNGKSFDIPTLNKEFLKHGMTPPAPYKQVDLYQVAKSSFRFPSNKLEYVAKALGCAPKRQHRGYEMWLACMDKRHSDYERCWKEMERYNRGDVVTLEDVYVRMLPWIRQHPNAGVWHPGSKVCPSCASTKLQRRGHMIAAGQKYVRYQCQECGTWCREPAGKMGKEVRSTLLRRVA